MVPGRTAARVYALAYRNTQHRSPALFIFPSRETAPAEKRSVNGVLKFPPHATPDGGLSEPKVISKKGKLRRLLVHDNVKSFSESHAPFRAGNGDTREGWGPAPGQRNKRKSWERILTCSSLLWFLKLGSKWNCGVRRDTRRHFLARGIFNRRISLESMNASGERMNAVSPGAAQRNATPPTQIPLTNRTLVAVEVTLRCRQITASSFPRRAVANERTNEPTNFRKSVARSSLAA